MYELIQKLIAFKYACKINHWSTNNYSKHLLFDRLTKDIDTWVDSIAEDYFMINNKKQVIKPDILNPKFIQQSPEKMCLNIISHLEELQNIKIFLDFFNWDSTSLQYLPSMLMHPLDEFIATPSKFVR